MNNNMDNNTKESEWKKRERGALWKKEGKSQNYLTGVIKSLDDMGQEVKSKVIVFANKNKTSENAPDFRLQAAGHDIGAAWKKTSEAGRDYLSVTADDPSFPVPVYARLIEGEDGRHDLIWSRSRPQAA